MLWWEEGNRYRVPVVGQRARHLQQSNGTGIDFNRWEMGLRADPCTAPGQKAERGRVRVGPGLSDSRVCALSPKPPRRACREAAGQGCLGPVREWEGAEGAGDRGADLISRLGDSSLLRSSLGVPGKREGQGVGRPGPGRS